MRRWMIFAVVMLIMGGAVASPAHAQSRTVYWERWDVSIYDVDPVANTYRVTEKYHVDFTGQFSFGSRVIDLVNITNILDVQVSQDGVPLNLECRERPGTFCTRTRSNEFTINYYFLKPITNGSAYFEIDYAVKDAIRIYEGGDQIWWSAIPSEHFGFRIGASAVDVTLPAHLTPREGVDPIQTYGVPTTIVQSGSQVIAKADNPLGGNDYLEIRVQFPHTEGATPPAWQANFDRTRDYDEHIRPIISLVLGIVSLAIGLAGPLFIYTRWLKHGKDPNVGPVPEFLTEPPSDLLPAIAGTLVDETADVRDVISTIIDLAHRGYIVIEESKTGGLMGFGERSEFVFKRTDKTLEGLRKYERTMMNRLFSGHRLERKMSSLKDSFYTTISTIQNQLYDEVVHEGLFTRNPNTVRSMWLGVGIVLIVLSVIFGFLMVEGIAESVSNALFGLPIAFGITGLTALVFASVMPAKTQKGALEAAKWNAFKTYLLNLERYSDTGEVVDKFDAFLPYAVAFGIEKTWMRKFRGIENMPVPTWYFPTHMGGPWRGGYRAGTPMRGGSFLGGDSGGFSGDIARAGGDFSLDGMSQSMSMGLESLSSGLSNMLDSASSTLTSRPQSSGGGGGGWSGGGGGGGGSSGGGSSGFG